MRLLLNKNFIFFGIILCALQAHAMQASHNNPQGKISLSIQANYSNQNKQYISDAVKTGLDKAQRCLKHKNKPWYFTALMEKNHGKTGQLILPEYHVSLAVVEHGRSTDTTKKLLGKQHVDCLTDLWRQYIKNDSQYVGQSQAIHMYVHGYNSANQEVHQHYALPSDHIVQENGLLIQDPETMIKDLKKRFAGGITHVHYVLAYEPQESKTGGIQHFNIVTNVEKLMTAIQLKKDDAKCPMKSLYEGKYSGFNAHTTIGVLKTVQGRVTFETPRISADEFADVVRIYEIIKVKFHKAQLTNMAFDHFSLKGLKMDGKQTTVVKQLQ